MTEIYKNGPIEGTYVLIGSLITSRILCLFRLHDIQLWSLSENFRKSICWTTRC